jgi:hypothetical protein
MKILLRIVEGATVVLVSDDNLASVEMLPTRYDLFQYRGGVAWGYKGSGVQNLGYAIAARLTEEMPEKMPDQGIHAAAMSLVKNLLSNLDGHKEHTIDQATLLNAMASD